MERGDLFDMLTSAMRAPLGEPVAGGRLRGGQVKSRLIEAHPANHDGGDDAAERVLASVSQGAELDLAAAGDRMWEIGGGRDSYFVDVFNSRFWLLHTTAPRRDLESLVRRHILSDPRLDTAWLPKYELDKLEGRRRWIKSSFSSDQLDVADETSEVPRRWRLQIEGERPGELLELIQSDSRYTPTTALTAVAATIESPGVGRADIAADYRGAFAATGSSFDVVAGALWSALDRYQGYVEALEERFRLTHTHVEDQGLVLSGEVVHIAFPRPIRDLVGFVDKLFSCREPFRLWAVPQEASPGQWSANAVDLHVGHPLRIELTASWMRILLSEGTCGNTVARLVSNLQHRYDARIAIAESTVAA